MRGNGHADEFTYMARHFGCLGGDLARPEAITGEPLESVHRVIEKRELMVAALPFPFSSAISRNRADDLVTIAKEEPSG